MFLAQRSCCFCYSLFDVVFCSMLLLIILSWHCLFGSPCSMLLLFLLLLVDTIIAFTNPCSILLVRCSLLNIPCWRYYYFYYSLLNAAIALVVPCLMMLLLLLFLLLFLIQHCYSSCCSLLDIVAFPFVHLGHNLFKYLFATPWCWCSLLLTPCWIVLLLLFLFYINNSPL
jgi:hypothetical protein